MSMSRVMIALIATSGCLSQAEAEFLSETNIKIDDQVTVKEDPKPETAKVELVAPPQQVDELTAQYRALFPKSDTTFIQELSVEGLNALEQHIDNHRGFNEYCESKLADQRKRLCEEWKKLSCKERKKLGDEKGEADTDFIQDLNRKQLDRLENGINDVKINRSTANRYLSLLGLIVSVILVAVLVCCCIGYHSTPLTL